MDERRRLRRRHLLGEVKIKAGDEWISAVLTNINRGGVGLYANGSLRKKEAVFVRITYLRRGRPTEAEEIPGKVCWIKPIGDSTAAGIAFTEKINRSSFPNLSKCIEYAMKGR